MPAWVIPAVTAAANLIGQGIAKGKDKRQIIQQGKLNEQQIEANTKMLGIQNNAALEMWEKTGYGAQKDQMKRADINPALLYGMSGGGGQSTGTGDASVNAPKAQGRTGREGEEATALGMQMIAQTELLKAQKENIEADTHNKRAEAGYTEGAKTHNTETNTKLQRAQEVKTQEEKDSIAYDNIIKDLVVNRDEKGNLVEEDGQRLAYKQKAAEYLKTTLENANIDAQTQKAIAEVAQKWKGLSLEERQVQLNEAVGRAQLENKDEDQIIQIISMILNQLTHGMIGGRRRGHIDTKTGANRRGQSGDD